MFAVGDVVVCVDNAPKKGPIRPIVPIHELIQKGRVYRINFIGRARFGSLTLGLEEVELPPPMMGFAPYRFRRISPADKEFSALLKRMKSDVRAPTTVETVGA